MDDATTAASPCLGSGYLLPSGECTLFACPDGYYRHLKTCQPCDSSCLSCSGPGSSECLACPSDHYINQGVCHPRQAVAPSNFEVLELHSADPLLAPGDRDGSAALPFLDLRDAITRANELAAPFLATNVTIFLSKGPHFVPLE